jgi:hypothetical protein
MEVALRRGLGRLHGNLFGVLCGVGNSHAGV